MERRSAVITALWLANELVKAQTPIASLQGLGGGEILRGGHRTTREKRCTNQACVGFFRWPSEHKSSKNGVVFKTT
jgi:hypothetical protein